MRSFYGTVAILGGLAITAWAGGSPLEFSSVTLAGPGYIKVSGGCECYAEGTLRFAPGGDQVQVTLNNAGGWYYDGNGPRDGFSAVVTAEEFRALCRQLSRLLTPDGELHEASTRAAVVEIRLPFKDGVFSLTAREIDGGCDFDVVLGALDDFVEMGAAGEWSNVKKD